MFRLSVLCLFSLVLAARASPALSTGPCANPAVVSNSTIQVGDAQVLMSSFSCASESESRAVGPDSSLAARTVDVCGDTCVWASCQLINAALNISAQAPSSRALEPELSPLRATAPSSRTLSTSSARTSVSGLHAQFPSAPAHSIYVGATYELTAANGYFKQLVFGTCLSFIGVSAQVDTEACWSDWVRLVVRCIPPTAHGGA